MPDHFHWIIALQNNCKLEQVMRSAKGISATQIQKIRRKRGKLNQNQALWPPFQVYRTSTSCL